MAVKISVLRNCYDEVVFWQTGKKISDCFAIEREKKLDGGEVQRSTLDNRMGFK